MPRPRQPRAWTDAALAEARTLFEAGALPLARIEAQTGVPRSTLQFYVLRQGWLRPPGARRPGRASPRLRRGGQTVSLDAVERRRVCVERFWSLVDHQLDVAEAQADKAATLVGREREARYLQQVARTMQACDAMALNAARAERLLAQETSAHDDAAGTRSRNEIYSDFSRRIVELFGGRAADDRGVAGGDDRMPDAELDPPSP